LKKKEGKPNRIIFLGTGGARVVVFKQIRASGGIWFSIDGTEFLLDPGPGALIRKEVLPKRELYLLLETLSKRTLLYSNMLEIIWRK